MFNKAYYITCKLPLSNKSPRNGNTVGDGSISVHSYPWHQMKVVSFTLPGKDSRHLLYRKLDGTQRGSGGGGRGFILGLPFCMFII